MRTIDKNTIQSYQDHIYIQEKSQNTIDKYIRDIRTFTAWLQTQEQKDITKECVIRYKKHLEDPAKPHLCAGKRDDARRIRKTHRDSKRE